MPDAPFVGEVGGSYVDPEFSESASQVVFQDMQNRVWIGDIDPETGLFKTATGRDYLMDENITIIFDRPPQGRKFSTNGPEWTRDEQGHLVVYTKADQAGIMQQWAARLVDGKSVVTQLTRQKLRLLRQHAQPFSGRQAAASRLHPRLADLEGEGRVDFPRPARRTPRAGQLRLPADEHVERGLAALPVCANTSRRAARPGRDVGRRHRRGACAYG